MAVEFPTHEVQIGDKSYRLTKLAAGPGRTLLFKIMKQVGPGLAKAFMAAGDGASEAKAAGAGLEQLVADLSEALYKEMVSTFAKNTLRLDPDGNTVRMDLTIDTLGFGSYADELTWLVESVSWNYADFLSLVKNIASRR